MGKAIELKPCPFCGSEKIKLWGDGVKAYWCQCQHCMASTTSDYKKDEAIKAWNMRK